MELVNLWILESVMVKLLIYIDYTSSFTIEPDTKWSKYWTKNNIINQSSVETNDDCQLYFDKKYRDQVILLSAREDRTFVGFI